MADNSFKINKSVNFNPQPTPANPVDGDFFYDATAQSFAYYHNGFWANFDSVGVVAATEPLTSAQLTPAIVRNAIVKITGGASPIHLDGISASHSGKTIKIYNAGTSYITVEHEDVGEPTANNKIRTPTGGDMNLVAGEIATFTYDVVASRWLLVSISSSAGAQLIATTSSPGLVSLHQASLFPADGIVLSDGDLNTANGVVGLDANRAVTIAAPTSTVTALTVTGASNAMALQLNGSSGGSNATALKVVRGTGSAFEWYSGATLLGAITNAGDLLFVSGDRQITFATTTLKESAPDLLTVQQGGQEFMRFQIDANFANLRATGPTATVIYDLIANEGSSAVQLVATTNHPLEFWTNNTARWAVASTGELQAQGGINRAIQNVLDPVTAQDAVTKNYADAKQTQNLVINGRLDFWQRGTTDLTITASASTGDGTYNRKRTYVADRWYMFSQGDAGTDGPALSGYRWTSVTAPTPFGFPDSLVIQRTDSNDGQFGVVQEIDRDFVIQHRGKKLTLAFWIIAGSGLTGQSPKVQLVTSSNASSAQVYKPTVTNGGAHGYSTSVTDLIALTNPSTIPTPGNDFVECIHTASVAVPTTATNMALIFQFGDAGSFPGAGDTNDFFAITGIRLYDSAAPGLQSYSFAGGSIAGELTLCQRYYEKSNDLGEKPFSGFLTGEETSTVLAISTLNGDPWPLGHHPTFQTRKRITPIVRLAADSGHTNNQWTIPAVGPRNSLAKQIYDGGFLIANDTGSTVTPTAGVAFGWWTADAEI